MHGIYEINALTWLAGLSAREGRPVTLGTVPPEDWDRIAAYGMSHVWLMGVWKRSALGARIFRESEEFERFRPTFDRALPGWTEADLAGSPYSVAAYEPDARVGTWADVDAAREALARRGIGLMLDFVPNHTAPDHPWATEHPEYYVELSGEGIDPGAVTLVNGRPLARGRDPYFPPWTDTLQLDYRKPETRRAVIAEMARVARHCDALRCDMAMLLLNNVFTRTWGGSAPRAEFWAEARAGLPGVALVAEAYWGLEPRLLALGFDYAYDKAAYDLFLSAPASALLRHLEANAGRLHKLVHFTENHDEPRAAAAFPAHRYTPALVLAATLPGTWLCHHGQAGGGRVRHPVQLGRASAEPVDARIAEIHARVLAARKALGPGAAFDLLPVHPVHDQTAVHIVAYTLRTDRAFMLVAVNLSEALAQGQIPLGGLDRSRSYRLTDLMDGAEYWRQGLHWPGLHVILAPGQAHLLLFH